MLRALIIAIALSLPTVADAQCANPLGITPASPTNTTPIVVAYRGYSCSEVTTQRIDGNVVTITTRCGCTITCIPVPRTLTIGPLAPGVYEVVVVDLHQPEFEQCATVTVGSDPAATPIPVAGREAVVLMILALASIAAVRIKTSS